MKIIDDKLIEGVIAQAKESPRLRMNYNFHQNLDDKCHRLLNALEVGTVVPIHRHPTKDESFVLLKGKIRVNLFNDAGNVTESVILNPSDGVYGVDIPQNVWHNVECLESGSVIFEVKEGPFVPHDKDGILQVE